MKVFAWLALSTLCATSFCQQLTKEHRASVSALNFLIGTWSGKVHFSAPGTDDVDATLKATPAVGRHYVQCEESMLFPGVPQEKLILLTYDSRAGLYESWAFNDMGAGTTKLSGSFEGDVLTLTSPAVLNAKGQNIAYREVYSVTKPRQGAKPQFTYELQAKLDDVWRTSYTITFTRQQ